jgi:hypothetical protein
MPAERTAFLFSLGSGVGSSLFLNGLTRLPFARARLAVLSRDDEQRLLLNK